MDSNKKGSTDSTIANDQTTPLKDKVDKVKTKKPNAIKTRWTKLQLKWRYVIIGSSTALVALGLTAAIAIPVVLNEVYALLDPFTPTGGDYNFNAAKKRGDKYNVLALGDSVTAGYSTYANSFSDLPKGSILEYESYVDFIAADLQRTNRLNNYTNFAHSGYTTSDLRDQVSQKVNVRNSISDADLIYISIGANDILPLIKVLGYNIFASGGSDDDAETGTHHYNPPKGNDKLGSASIAGALNDINTLNTNKQIGSQILGYNYDKEYVYDRINYIITNIMGTLRDIRKINNHALITFIGYAYPFNSLWDYSDKSTLANGFPGIPQFFDTFLSTMNDELADRFDFVDFFNVNKDKDFTKNIDTYMPNHADIHPSIAGQAEIGTKLFERIAPKINASYNEKNLAKSVKNNHDGIKTDFEEQNERPKDALQNSNILDVMASLGDKKRMDSYKGNFAKYIYGGPDDLDNVYIKQDSKNSNKIDLFYLNPYTAEDPTDLTQESWSPYKPVDNDSFIGNNEIAKFDISSLFSSNQTSANVGDAPFPYDQTMEALATLYTMGLGNILDDIDTFAPPASLSERKIASSKALQGGATMTLADYEKNPGSGTDLTPNGGTTIDPYLFAKVTNTPVKSKVDLILVSLKTLTNSKAYSSYDQIMKTILSSVLNLSKADTDALYLSKTDLDSKIKQCEASNIISNQVTFSFNLKTYNLDNSTTDDYKFFKTLEKQINDGVINMNDVIVGYLKLIEAINF